MINSKSLLAITLILSISVLCSATPTPFYFSINTGGPYSTTSPTGDPSCSTCITTVTGITEDHDFYKTTIGENYYYVAGTFPTSYLSAYTFVATDKNGHVTNCVLYVRTTSALNALCAPNTGANGTYTITIANVYQSLTFSGSGAYAMLLRAPKISSTTNGTYSLAGGSFTMTGDYWGGDQTAYVARFRGNVLTLTLVTSYTVTSVVIPTSTVSGTFDLTIESAFDALICLRIPITYVHPIISSTTGGVCSAAGCNFVASGTFWAIGTSTYTASLSGGVGSCTVTTGSNQITVAIPARNTYLSSPGANILTLYDNGVAFNSFPAGYYQSTYYEEYIHYDTVAGPWATNQSIAIYITRDGNQVFAQSLNTTTNSTEGALSVSGAVLVTGIPARFRPSATFTASTTITCDAIKYDTHANIKASGIIEWCGGFNCGPFAYCYGNAIIHTWSYTWSVTS